MGICGPSFCHLVDDQSVNELFGTVKPYGKPCELHEQQMSHMVLSINDSSSIFSSMVPSLTSIAKKLILLNFENFAKFKFFLLKT